MDPGSIPGSPRGWLDLGRCACFFGEKTHWKCTLLLFVFIREIEMIDNAGMIELSNVAIVVLVVIGDGIMGTIWRGWLACTIGEIR